MTENQADLYIDGRLMVIARSLASSENHLCYSIRRWVSIFELKGKVVRVMWRFEDTIYTYAVRAGKHYQLKKEPILIAA